MKNKNLKELNYIRDLENLLNQVAKYDCINPDDLVLFLEKQGIGTVGKCAICGGFYVMNGNNPAPYIVDDDARCCSSCNYAIVHIAHLGISIEPLKKSSTLPYKGKI